MNKPQTQKTKPAATMLVMKKKLCSPDSRSALVVHNIPT